VDSTKFRRWNMDPEVLALCPPIIHAGDVASVGQPPPAAAQPQPKPMDRKPETPVYVPQTESPAQRR